jgi:restriction endonuclease S subunit
VRSLHVDYYHPERRLVIRAIQEKWNSAQRNILGKVLAIGEETALYQPGLPYIGLANVESDNGIFVESSDEEPEGLCRRFLHGQVLYGKLRPYLNKVYIAQSDGQCSTEFFVLNVLEQTQLSNEFLQAYLTSKICLAQTVHMMTGNTHPRILREDFKEILIPLPPFANQRALVAEMQAARASRQQKLAQADALLAGLDAYLLEQLGITPPQEDKRQVYAVRFGDIRATQRLNAEYFHPERILAIRAMRDRQAGLRAERLADIADFVRDLAKVSAEDDYVGLANVQSNTGELVESNDKDGEDACLRFAQGDVLFARLRPYLNKVHRAEKDGVCSTEFHIIRVRPENKILPDYLATILRSSLILVQTRHMMTGNTHPRLTNDDVVNLVVPIPDNDVQKVIVAEVNHCRETARQLRAQAAAEWDAAKARFEKKLLGS